MHSWNSIANKSKMDKKHPASGTSIVAIANANLTNWPKCVYLFKINLNIYNTATFMYYPV